MSVVIASVPAAPRAKVDTARIDLTGNDEVTPVYLSVEKSGVDTAKSQIFVGNGLLFTHIFPSAGTYTVFLRKAADDSDLSTGGQAVVVS